MLYKEVGFVLRERISAKILLIVGTISLQGLKLSFGFRLYNVADPHTISFCEAISN